MSKHVEHYDNVTDQVKAMMEAAGIKPADGTSVVPVNVNVKNLHIHIGERKKNTYMTVSGDYTCGNHACGAPLFDDPEEEDEEQSINLEEMIGVIHEKTGFRICDITEMMQAQLAFLKSIYGNEPCGSDGCDGDRNGCTDGREV